MQISCLLSRVDLPSLLLILLLIDSPVRFLAFVPLVHLLNAGDAADADEAVAGAGAAPAVVVAVVAHAASDDVALLAEPHLSTHRPKASAHLSIACQCSVAAVAAEEAEV